MEKIVAICMLGLFLSGCGTMSPFSNARQAGAPIKNIPISIQQTYYTVQPGDNLYSVSQRFNLTERTLIIWNEIPPPFILTPGEKIQVGPIHPQAEHAAQLSVPTTITGEDNTIVQASQVVGRTETLPNSDFNASPATSDTPNSYNTNSEPDPYAEQNLNISVPSPADSATVVHHNAVVARKVVTTQQPSEVKIKQTEQPVPAVKQRIVPNNLPIGKVVSNIRWSWPLHTKGRFSENNLNTLKEIGVPTNTKVYAAASGSVVYVGISITGDGKMVILSHKDGYITAYNHLDDTQMKENENVKVGQLIGSIGRYDGNSSLWFEIRRHGSVLNLIDFYNL